MKDTCETLGQCEYGGDSRQFMWLALGVKIVLLLGTSTPLFWIHFWWWLCSVVYFFHSPQTVLKYIVSLCFLKFDGRLGTRSSRNREMDSHAYNLLIKGLQKKEKEKGVGRKDWAEEETKQVGSWVPASAWPCGELWSTACVSECVWHVNSFPILNKWGTG